MPDRLNPMGWLAMISLSDPAAGMNQPSKGTPSRAGEGDVLVVQALFGGPVQDRRAKLPAERVGHGLQGAVDLLLGGSRHCMHFGHVMLLISLQAAAAGCARRSGGRSCAGRCR